MTEEIVLLIGNKNLSSWSLRPWLLLRQAGIPFREHLVLFETPGWRTAIGALSPSGRVPALRHGTIAIWDSLAIAEYVAETFPEARLWPADRAARALARAMSAEMHSGFPQLRSELSMDVTARFAPGPVSAEASAQIARVLAIWTDARTRSEAAGTPGPFLFGAFSVADAMFAPVAYRFRSYAVEVTEPHARAYLETMLALPAMKEWEEAARLEVEALQAAPAPATTPDPTTAQHCFAVIFSSQRTATGDEAYARTSRAMDELARKQPGYLGMESARNPDGSGITVSYWDSLPAIKAWKDVAAHRAAQEEGRRSFYERYEVRIASVERGYRFPS
ncbi:MAG: putative glutathione S-transferase with Thioredoxin domain [Labilithrix sp.]|nr:putative glutathione S-transferase with Thioredoxin domain [Labilithrix sp.]